VAASAGPEIERLIGLLSKLPGLGPRSARRAALALLKRREQLLLPLAASLAETADRVKSCSVCGAPDTRDPCTLCADPARDAGLICVVEEAGALWAMERSGAFRGRYHVLGGLLSALDGVGPESLRLGELVSRSAATSTGWTTAPSSRPCEHGGPPRGGAAPSVTPLCGAPPPP
jgi:recombination protein RecR